MFSKTVENYGQYFNPLGLVDDTVREIMDFQLINTESLQGIYENLSAIYRYKYGEAQLEILWDGSTHFDKYSEDWKKAFEQWVGDLTQNKTFIKGVLHLTVFEDDCKNTFFIRNIMKGIINEYFDLKVLKINGAKRVYLKVP